MALFLPQDSLPEKMVERADIRYLNFYFLSSSLPFGSFAPTFRPGFSFSYAFFSISISLLAVRASRNWTLTFVYLVILLSPLWCDLLDLIPFPFPSPYDLPEPFRSFQRFRSNHQDFPPSPFGPHVFRNPHFLAPQRLSKQSSPPLS